MLVFCDSFDHYATADLPVKWTSISVGTSNAITAAVGRRGTSAWEVSAGRTLARSVASAATYVIGFAFKNSALSGSVDTIATLAEGATIHLSLRLNSDGSLTVARNTTALGTSAAGVIGTAAYNYIEFKGNVHDTTGSYEVKVNGGSVLSGSGADTRNGGTGVITSIELRGFAGATCDFDDFYACDTTGSLNNDFLGDVRVDAYLPNGNGNSSGLTGSDADSVDNYLLVDDAAPDGDTTYVESAVATTKDTYAFADMSHTPSSIKGVQIIADAKKDDAGARSIATVVRSNGVDTDGATVALSTSYVMYRTIHETDPDTSVAWIKAGFNAAEFGVKVAA